MSKPDDFKDMTTLTTEQKRTLLKIARESIRKEVSGEHTDLPKPDDSVFTQPCGAFVTIRMMGDLRGCIGYIEASRPMTETVADAARAAATHDPRFEPIRSDELNKISLEVSLLSPFESIRAENVIPGVHGLYLIKSSHRGLLLPQVAAERGWDRETYLDNLCLKAGMPPGCWRDGVYELLSFTAVVFSDDDIKEQA